jgi:hypothetical protein
MSTQERRGEKRSTPVWVSALVPLPVFFLGQLCELLDVLLQVSALHVVSVVGVAYLDDLLPDLAPCFGQLIQLLPLLLALRSLRG